MDYVWIYLLGGLALISFALFLATFSKDLYLTKKMRLKRITLLPNLVLLGTTLSSLSLVIYLFILLKEQIKLIG